MSTTDILPMIIFTFTVVDGICSFGCCVTSKHVWDNANICCYLVAISKDCWSKDIVGSTTHTHVLPTTILICLVAPRVWSFGSNAPARAQPKLWRCGYHNGYPFNQLGSSSTRAPNLTRDPTVQSGNWYRTGLGSRLSSTRARVRTRLNVTTGPNDKSP